MHKVNYNIVLSTRCQIIIECLTTFLKYKTVKSKVRFPEYIKETITNHYAIKITQHFSKQKILGGVFT